MVGRILESIATPIMFMYTFFRNEISESPVILCIIINLTNTQATETIIEIIKGLSGMKPSLRNTYESRKLNRVIPPIVI